MTWPVPEKLSSVSPPHQSINQAAHCSELPLLCLAACINHINTLGFSKLPNHKVPKQRAEEDAGAFLSDSALVSGGSAAVQVGPLVPWWQQLSQSGVGVSTGGAKALPGWEKVQDYGNDSYSEFLGPPTYAEGGQGLLLEVVQRGFSAACDLLSVCIPIFITPVSDFLACLICNNDNIVRACPFQELSPLSQRPALLNQSPFLPSPCCLLPILPPAQGPCQVPNNGMKPVFKTRVKKEIQKAKSRKAKHCLLSVSILPLSPGSRQQSNPRECRRLQFGQVAGMALGQRVPLGWLPGPRKEQG